MKKEKVSPSKRIEIQTSPAASLKYRVQKLSLKKEIVKISDNILALLDTCDQFVINPVKPIINTTV